MEVIIATLNHHKLEEFSRILNPLGYTVVSRSKYCDDIEVEETGKSFAENARIKAKAVFDLTHKPCVADDSGLCIDYLNGEPGIFSARFSGVHGNYQSNNDKVLSLMKDVPMEKRSARFICSVCFYFSDTDIVECEGICEGKIAFEPKGINGFGYDPIFLYGEKTIAEMTNEEKDRISHRSQALKDLVTILHKRG